ncbi:MAG: hypothetical protein KAQ98_04865 [Bacteriovoracaceae bacterium]|nr:hypothetical protein [Bacteriovoracaceae bacterium]
MEPLNIEYHEKSYKVAPLTNTLEFITQHNIPVKFPVAAVVNGYLTRLNKKFKVDSNLEIVELDTSQGRRVYESGVLFLFWVAFHKKFPEGKVFINHSLHMGVYAEVAGDNELSEEDINSIEKLMEDMVKKCLPLERKTRDWDISMDILKHQERQDLLNLYRYYTPTQYKYYELNGVEENLYLPQLPNTKYLKYFKLKKYQQGIVIIIPDFEEDVSIPEFVDRPKLFNTYKEYHEWSRILKVRMVGQLNRYIMNDEIMDLIRVAEALHEKKMAEIADHIATENPIPKLVLIAGPSSAGKTTFSKRLGIQLRVNGLRPVSINLDNYFVDREKTPHDKNGNYDFESIDAIDIKLFNEHITKLLNGELVELPKFNFHTGRKKKNGIKMKLESDQIIIIEGIHGLNPKLTNSIDASNKFSIYISALTQLNTHMHDRIPTSDTRLIRRIVRDSYFRGYSAQETLERWRSVRAGEKKNIFPLQENANMIFNSALFYELSVLKLHAERELRRVERESPVYAEARRLLKFLSYFLPIEPKDIPATSILREFIGGSAFDY